MSSLPQKILSLFKKLGQKQDLAISDIMLALQLDQVQKRAVQRHLHQLLKQQKLVRHGHGRATRYAIAQKPNQQSIILSKTAEQIRQHLTKPMAQRQQVFYHKDFLNRYVPNQTFYLSASQRAHLKKIGSQTDYKQPAGTFANQILSRLLVDLSWNSSRLEGNTYSLLDTKHLIEFGQAAEGKSLFETRMILNHKAAIEFLVELGEDLQFSRYVILNLHALLSYNLLGDSSASGRLRTIPVGIAKTVYQPLAIPQLVEDCFSKVISTANAIDDPLEQAFFVMVHLPYLQPFVDVNKRVSRVAANIPLIKHNYCPISFIDVSKQMYIDGILGVYELNQVDLLADVFIWAYERSTERYVEARAYLTEPDAFVEQYDRAIREVINIVIEQKLSKKAAASYINNWSEQHVEQQDCERFIEVVQTELLALHEGNIAKFKIKLADFQAWQRYWQA